MSVMARITTIIIFLNSSSNYTPDPSLSSYSQIWAALPFTANDVINVQCEDREDFEEISQFIESQISQEIKLIRLD